jgi:ubiquinone biosynthesis protein COQ4
MSSRLTLRRLVHETRSVKSNHQNGRTRQRILRHRQHQQQQQHQHQQQRSLHTEPFYGAPRPLAQPDNNNNTWRLLFQNAAAAMNDPTRADAVAAVGELTGRLALQRMLKAMQANAVGQKILKDRPIVSKATIPYHQLLASRVDDSDTATATDITFGQAYGAFLHRHGFDPDERDCVRYIEDPDLAYVMLRYRQCHDFWHTLTNLPPTVPGELGLKWLELFQTGLPLAALSSTVGSWTQLKSYEEQQVVWGVYLPWAQRVGTQMPFGQLLNVYYEHEWDTPIQELRARLNIEPAPQHVLEKKNKDQ